MIPPYTLVGYIINYLPVFVNPRNRRFSLTSQINNNIIIGCNDIVIYSNCFNNMKEGLYMKKLEDYVRTIPDFPEPGIMFRDVTSVLQDAEGLRLAVDEMQEKVKDLTFDVIAGPESRGFIFGMPMAYNLHKPFVLIRKKGKLPCETVSVEYELEYGTATIEMHKDAIKPGQKVLIVDDLIATGGTTEAMIQLVEQLGGEVVGIDVLMELAGLNGRDKIQGYRLDSAIVYPGK